MFGIIFYLGACLIASGTITFLWVTFKPIGYRDDMRSMRVGVFLFLLTALAPYGYVEFLTARHSPELAEAIRAGYEGSELRGDLLYSKVVSYEPGRARVIAVGFEEQDWGGTDRPIIAMTLELVDGEWDATSYHVVYSFRLDRENSTFPPYR